MAFNALLPAYQVNPNPFQGGFNALNDGIDTLSRRLKEDRERERFRMAATEALARTPGVGLAQAESLAQMPEVARNVLMQYSDPMLGMRKNQAEAELSMVPLKRQQIEADLAMNPLRRQQMQGQIAASAVSTEHARSMSPYQLQQARIAAQSAEREFNTPKPNTFDLAEGHARYETVRNPDGTTSYRKVAEGGAKISATAQKAIDEADDFVKQSGSAIGALREAMRLNDTAYSGVAAGTRAAIVNNIPLLGGTKSSLATTDLDNLITNQALSALRSTFGGNPTEGERKILLEVAGSVNLPPEARAKILRRALIAAEQSQQFNLQKGDALRGGTYYQPGGLPRAGMVPSSPSPARFRATNPQTGQQIQSDDGVNWRPVGGN